MKKGPLNRKIRIERPVTTREPIYGTSKTTWEKVATPWAEVKDYLPSKAKDEDDNIVIQRRPTRIRMLYREGITADMRIIYRGRIMEIVSGPAELGRRDGLELVAQEISTQGDAP